MHEKRLVERLRCYWESLKSDVTDPAPNFSKFNNAAIADIWDNCLLLQVVQNHNSKYLYRYDYMGDKVRAVYGSDLSGEYVNEHMHHFPGWQVLKEASQSLVTPQVYISEGHFINERSRVVKYRSCLLPFAMRSRISHILVGLSWKEF